MDKRNYKRIKSDFKVLIESENSQEASLKMKEGTSVNISGGGILLEYSKPLELNEIIRVKFLKPNSFDFFEGIAKVVRVEINPDKSYDLGIEFINLSKNDRVNLEYYLQLA